MRKAIFITGAASGIGRATARLFARNGWFVGLYDVDREGLAAARREVGEEASAMGTLDVTDLAQFRAAVADFGLAAGDRLDVMFNCAGVLAMTRFEDHDPERAARMVDINVKGVMHGVWAALPLLARTPGACVLNMASASAIYGVPEMAVYSASKFFVKGLTEALDLELAHKDIRVRDISPSFVATPMVTRQTYAAGTVSTLGVKLVADDVADVVWKAANAGPRGRVHWYPQGSVAALARIAGLIPGFTRSTMRRLAKL